MPNSWSWLPKQQRTPSTPIAPPQSVEGLAPVSVPTGPVIPAGELSDAEPVNFDPTDHTITEVQAHVEAYPDTWQTVYDREAEGKGRVTLLAWLQENKP